MAPVRCRVTEAPALLDHDARQVVRAAGLLDQSGGGPYSARSGSSAVVVGEEASGGVLTFFAL